MTDEESSKMMEIYQAEYGRALHVLLYHREQIPWRFMERLWCLSSQLAFEAAWVDEEAATRPPAFLGTTEVGLDRKHHDTRGWMGEDLGGFGFKRIAVTDGEGRSIGYVTVPMEGLREQIEDWNRQCQFPRRASKPPVSGVDMRNVRVRLRQLERILDELRTDVLDPSVRARYREWTGGSSNLIEG